MQVSNKEVKSAATKSITQSQQGNESQTNNNNRSSLSEGVQNTKDETGKIRGEGSVQVQGGNAVGSQQEARDEIAAIDNKFKAE